MKKQPPTYLEAREAEPIPVWSWYAEGSVEELCANQLNISEHAIQGLVEIATKLLGLKADFVTNDDRDRFAEYVSSGHILAANHTDAADILTLGALAASFDVYMRYVGKADIPQPLTKLGLIPVDRSERADPAWLTKMLKVAKYTLCNEQRPLVVFPEGSIHPEDHTVHDIQPGIFVLSQTTKARVVPIAIYGTAHLLSEYSASHVLKMAVSRHPVHVAVGEPIDFDGASLLAQGYDVPTVGKERREFMGLLLRVLIQEQYNRAAIAAHSSSTLAV